MTTLSKLKYILKKSEKKNLMLLAFGSVFLSLSEILSIGIIIPIMSLFLEPEKIATSKIFQFFNQVFKTENTKYFFVVLISAAIIVFISKSIYSIFVIYQQQKVIGRIYSRLTTKVLQTYLAKPYSFHLVNNSSLLFKNMNVEISNFVFGFISSLILMGSETIVFLGISLFLLLNYPFATSLFISIFGAVVLFINFFFKKNIKSYSDARAKYSEQLYKSGIESLNSIKEVKIYNVPDFFTNTYYQAAKRYTDYSRKFNVLSALPRPILETILFILVFLFLLINIFMQKSSSELIPIMMLFAVASLRLIPSFNKIYININTMHYFTNSFGVAYDIIKEESRERKIAVDFPKAEDTASGGELQTIRLENITFCYGSADVPIFEGFNLTIPLQRSTGIFGTTGVGKSTVIDIIMGLLVPNKGLVYYKGAAVNERNIQEYRKKIGYVPQDIFLTDDTIEANIAFGVLQNEINYEQIERVIKIAELESFIKKELPLGMKTIVGERGIRISGGQKQRIGIARALYRNPQIIILDEATSALDRHTETKVLDAIRNLASNPTIVIVSHRLTTIEHCDIIYVIEKGKVVDQGNFKELLEGSLIFRKVTEQKFASSLKK